MKSYFFTCILTVLFLASTFTASFAQDQWRTPSISAELSTSFNHIPKKPGHYSATDWAAIIDSTWGQGLPTATKLAIFDNSWNRINAEFACFQGLNVDMDSLRLLYRPEIADTSNPVSRGRFAAIMNYFALSFKEGHNFIVDEQVNFNNNTPPAPGVPLFVVGAWTDNSHFGATLTPLPDSSLLVIKTLPAHPLGLVRGDIVLGYDGIPWKVLYKEILTAQLPFFLAFMHPSAEKSFTHDMLKNAGMNWHLFDTLDVVKHSSGDTMHYPTALLAGQSGNLAGNEQMDIPGVPFPDINWQGVFNFDVYNQINYVSWGIIDGTNIGYIYVYSWATPVQAPGSDIANEFYRAIDSLMNYHDVEGLILDSRLDFGYGQFDTDDPGFSLLFNSYIETVAIDERCGDPNNHFQMCPHPLWTPGRIAIPGDRDPNTFFDRPIAVLTGPGAFSMGDYIPLKMRFHPMTRIFGKSTAGAFVGTSGTIIPYSGWLQLIASGNAYLVNDPGNYLCRTESHVDEEVWFTQDDVANGEDTVVKAALDWINSMIYAFNVKLHSQFVRPAIDTLTITANVANPNAHNINAAAIINTLDGVFVDSIPMFDDGNHGDSLASDGLYGGFLNPLSSEDIFTISTSVTDLDSSHYHILTNATRFTTIGPVIFDKYRITSSDTIPHDGDILKFEFTLRNDGLTSTATNITIQIASLDTFSITHPLANSQYGDIQPGSTAVGNSTHRIEFDLAALDSVDVKFRMEISSNGYLFWSDTFSVFVIKDSISIIIQDENIPTEYSLKQNFPNPFNPSTIIEFGLPKAEFVSLKVYNLLGQQVVTLVSERLKAGNYNYSWDASQFASGVYFYKLEAGDYIKTKKLLLLK